MKAFVCVLLFTVAACAQGTTEFMITLDGAHALPPNASSFRVPGVFTLNGNLLHSDLKVDEPYASGLTSIDLVSSTSPAFPGTFVSQFTMTAYVDNEAPEISFARFSIDLTLTDTQRNDLCAGFFYVNLTTPAFPNGEVRGQVVVPEPPTVALCAFGALVVLFYRRLRFGTTKD
jgi:hypothetical protein